MPRAPQRSVFIACGITIAVASDELKASFTLRHPPFFGVRVPAGEIATLRVSPGSGKAVVMPTKACDIRRLKVCSRSLPSSEFDLVVDYARLARRAYRPNTKASPARRTAEFAFCLEPVRDLASRRTASR